MSFLTAGRRAAEARFLLTLAAYSPNGSTTDADGYQVPAFTTQTPTVGKVQGTSQRDTATRFVSVAGVDRPVLSGALHIPISATVPAAGHRGTGWEYVVTEVRGDADQALLGRRYLVVDAPAKSEATARRLDVVEL